MSVGGRIIEIAQHSLNGKTRTRLWVVDRNGDESGVFVEDAPDMPKVGDEVWWQAGKVYFDGDSKHLIKISNSFDISNREPR